MTIEQVKDSDSLAVGGRRRDLPRAVWVLVLARAVNRLGAFTLSFLTVVLVEDLGASLSAAGWVVAAFGLATILSRLAGGRLADRIGRVPTICLGLVGCAAAQLWVAVSASFEVAIVGVVLLGLAFELYEPPSQALVADLTTEAERPLAYGLLGAALTVAGAGAGLLAVALGAVDLRWLLVVDAATCLVTAAFVALAVRDPGGVRPEVGARAASCSPWRDPRLLALLVAGTCFAVVYMTVVVSLPLALSSHGLAPERAGLVLTASAVVAVVATPLLRLRVLSSDSFRALTVGYAVLAAGLAANAVADSVAGFVLAALLWSVGDLVVMGHAWTLVIAIAPVASRGRYLAAYGVSWGVATTLAPMLGTQLLVHGGPQLLWLGLAAIALLLAAGQWPLAQVCRAPRAGSSAPGEALALG